MKTLPQVLDEARQCVKCGTCMAHCPVYLETLEEPLVARGKLGLIEAVSEGDGEFNKRFGKILSQCLLCGTCSENCPNGVRADAIIRDARSLLVKEKGLSLPKKTIFKYLLDSKHLMPLLLKGGASLQHLFLKGIPEESGLRLRLTAIDFAGLQPAAQGYTEGLAKARTRPGTDAATSYFVGCLANHLQVDRNLGPLKCHHFKGGRSCLLFLLGLA